jgi:hypothetical protein
MGIKVTSKDLHNMAQRARNAHLRGLLLLKLYCLLATPNLADAKQQSCHAQKSFRKSIVRQGALVRTTIKRTEYCSRRWYGRSIALQNPVRVVDV